MKQIVIALRLDCRDDVPAEVLAWMIENLEEYAWKEFGRDYDPGWTDTGYPGPPVLVEGHVVGRVITSSQ